MSNQDGHLSPAEAARRLGVTIKALRLYERHGLVKPQRTGADWRVYGPEQMARLHQVLALKRMGLSLGRIAELLAGKAASLGSVLALQEQVLSGESARVAHALALVRAARARLSKGESLSIDDLTTLTKETTMTAKASGEELRTLMQPHIAKHFSPDELTELKSHAYDPAATQSEWDGLIANARAMVARGENPASPAAQDLARRWSAMVARFTQGIPKFETKAKAVWDDAMADSNAAGKLPIHPEIFAFVNQAHAAAKAAGE